MYSSRGNNGYITNTDMFYAKQLIFAKILEAFCFLTMVISQNQKKILQSPNSFWALGSQIPPLFPALEGGMDKLKIWTLSPAWAELGKKEAGNKVGDKQLVTDEKMLAQ